MGLKRTLNEFEMTMAIFLTDWHSVARLFNSYVFRMEFGMWTASAPAPLLLLPCSCIASGLLLACSWSAPALLLVLVLVLPSPVWQPSSSSPPYDIYRHGESCLSWYTFTLYYMYGKLITRREAPSSLRFSRRASCVLPTKSPPHPLIRIRIRCYISAETFWAGSHLDLSGSALSFLTSGSTARHSY